MHWIPILLVLLLYMFRAAFLPIIRSSEPYVGFSTLYAVVMTVCYQEYDGTQFDPTPGRKRSSQLHKIYQSRRTAKNSWWWAERLPETCRIVILIKLEFSASVGFIHKEPCTSLWRLVYPRFRTIDLGELKNVDHYGTVTVSSEIHM